MSQASAGRKPKPKAALAPRRNVVVEFADERCPSLGDLLEPHGIAAVPFEAWLGECLGDYRFALLARASMPPRADELAVLREVGEALDAAARQLGAEHGPRGEAQVYHAALQLGRDWHQLARQLRQDLALAGGIVQAAAGRLESGAQKKGRPPQGPRDALLSAVVARLQGHNLPAGQAQSLASEVLLRCRVGVPSDERSTRRAIKRKG